MSQLAVGVDLVEVRRIAELLAEHGERFTRRVYTPAELADCAGRADSLAARWAAKEAAAKALGAGIGAVSWQEIEVARGPGGQPVLRLHAAAAALAAEQGLTQWALSLTHDGGLAAAFVVAM
jgi:holo-[acyl-carrier protein] synthase